MRKYDVYKHSGVEWIGEIPIHWKIKKLCYSFDIIKGKIPHNLLNEKYAGSLPYISMDVIRGGVPKEFSTDDQVVRVDKGDIGILWDGANSGEVICMSLDGILSSTVSKIIVKDDSLIKIYSYYLLKSYENDFRNNTIGMGIPHINGNHFKESLIILPSIKEQKQIVEFLDSKTSLIDTLIAKTLRKIELLKEIRTSLISEAVTKGLNPNVEMKYSGVEWIGEIPAHWMVSKFKYLTKKEVQYGINVSSDTYKTMGIRFIRTTDIDAFGNLKGKGVYVDEGDINKSYIIEKFDFLVSRSGTLGKTYIHSSEDKMTYGGYLVRFHFGNPTTSKLIKYYCYTDSFDDWMILNSIVSTIGNINGQKYNNMEVPIPNQNEQKQIVEYLDKQTQLIDKMISVERKKIKLLKEFRQSIISEVVTGKRKVVA